MRVGKYTLVLTDSFIQQQQFHRLTTVSHYYVSRQKIYNKKEQGNRNATSFSTILYIFQIVWEM